MLKPGSYLEDQGIEGRWYVEGHCADIGNGRKLTTLQYKQKGHFQISLGK